MLVLAALLLSLSLPAQALFDLDDQVTGDSPKPIAEHLTLTTYKNVAVEGNFAAVDPDGEGVTFRITKNPARGAVTQAEEGSAAFTYTPYEGKLGKDSFTYVAEDASGNVSQPALVSIKITRPDTKVTYADMSGHPAHKAAIALAAVYLADVREIPLDAAVVVCPVDPFVEDEYFHALKALTVPR
jgi:hypothetical protein